jgi:hypothetical protein
MNQSNYEVITSDFGNVCIKRTDENGQVWFIPTDPANSDYQAYLATLVSNSSTPQAGN